ncbi:microfibril-associated glycoprotein 4-like isoform X2 [Mytilus edulis]|uniref:microfibril-associated glycoprotein 4-like isoform X2 n=1 Tax=Mytilus edulis TaxID=6550 RepID=UPI0039EFBA6E
MNRLIICFTVFIVLKGSRSEPTFMDNERYGQICASCSGVETSNECEHNIRCDLNEVCSMHYYVTESGKSLFDYGCAVPQTCLQGFAPIFGKRSEGHHVKCVVCCNDTIACNRNLTCNQNSSFPRECSDIKGILKSGVYTIYPFGKPTPLISVFCEVDGNGNVWTDIQKRIDGTVDFFRNWTDYKNGFGNAQGEYWIGNDIIHQITSNGNHKLQIIMTDFSSVTKYANYDSFSVSNETNGYQLSVGGYSGDAGDSLTRHNGQKFTTDDRDNDPYGGWNCATHYHGAWWYEACHDSNLNGKYTLTSDCPYGTGIIWYTFHSSYYYCLKSTTMMIRRN